MKPIGPLMVEHRAIERMIALMEEEKERIERSGEVDTVFISAVIDYFTIYVDMTHHAKEEDIQFKKLAEKNMTPELQRIMQELIVEHNQAREIIRGLEGALKAHGNGDNAAAKRIEEELGEMNELYPAHIEKEDKRFFFPTLQYLSLEEQYDMLEAFWKYDSDVLHKKYDQVVEAMQSRLAKSPA